MPKTILSTLVALTLYCCSIVAQNTPSTFIKKYGLPGVSESGYTLCPAGDDNLYIAGQEDKKTFIMKVSPEGLILAYSSFVVNPFEPVVPSDLLLDSEGKLVGCGTTGVAFGLHKGFVFRYDPLTSKLLWIQIIASNRPQSAGLMEKSPGGNYLYHQVPQPGNNLETEWLELNRQTGAIVPALAKRYRYNDDIKIAAAVQHKGALYGVGFSLGKEYHPDSNAVRYLLMKTDTATGAVEWANLSFADTTSRSIAQSGLDLLIDEDTLVSVGSSIVSNPALFPYKSGLVLQKNTLDGQIAWTKQYDAGFDPDNLIRFGSGYIISGIGSLGTRYVFQTDRDGNPLWARKLDLSAFSVNYNISGHTFQDQLVALDGYLYLVMAAAEDVVLVKMDAQGNVAGNCDYIQSIPVTMTPVDNPVNTPIVVAADNSPAVATAAATPIAGGNLPVSSLCPLIPCANTLDLGPDQILCGATSVTLDAGSQFVKYLWWNGSKNQTLTTTLGGTHWVLVVDSCGNKWTDTVHVEFRPLPHLEDTLSFCPGDTIFLNGTAYTQPAVALDTLPGAGGACDTVIQTVLHYLSDGFVPTLTLKCPPGQKVTAVYGATSAPVQFADPVPSGDCPCPGTSLNLTQGLASGKAFPLGPTTVCFQAGDQCGATASCCFTVQVTAAPPPDAPCDVKENGCVTFEMLRIVRNTVGRKTYFFRITNHCQSALTTIYVQVPDGVQSVAPVDNATYTAPGGHTYTVRNPNFSPFYSVRFQAKNGGIGSGASDEFRFTLPPQADPVFIHTAVRSSQGYVETHLNTFSCTVQDEFPKPAAERMEPAESAAGRDFVVYPNPSSGVLYADLSVWAGETLDLSIWSTQGQLLDRQEVEAGAQTAIRLPEHFQDGLYVLELRSGQGERSVKRFMLYHQ